jgi:RNA polymerase sigma factor (TIGR02999 family)
MELTWSQLPDITLLIRKARAGNRKAEHRLFDLAYPFLSRIASGVLRRAWNHPVGPLDVLHDVYLDRLRDRTTPINDRHHFLALAATAMKSDLKDRARRSTAKKRTPLEKPFPAFPQNGAGSLRFEERLALVRELERLEEFDLRAARVVQLRYYFGCSWEETAVALGATVKMVRTDWEFAAKWLGDRLGR